MSYEQIWGLKTWLQSMDLIKYYVKFETMNQSELLSLTKSELSEWCTPEDADILEVAIGIVNGDLELLALLTDAYCKGCEVCFMLQQLEYILPSPFQPLLGQVSSNFVELMELINLTLLEDKAKPMNSKNITLFCKLCINGEQSEYFMMIDKENLQTMRLQHQEAAKPAEKN